MSFLLDTNILSAHLRGRSDTTNRFVQYSGRLYTPSLVMAELYVWAFRRPDPTEILSAIEKMLCYEVAVVNYDNDCALTFGRIRAELQREGIGVNPIDLMIASVALTHDLTLVTHNTSDFHRIPNLRLEDWIAAR